MAALLLAGALAAPAGAAGRAFKSADEALEKGVEHYRGGAFDRAIPALRSAAGEEGRSRIPAQYYLARIFADPGTAVTDHRQAYNLFLQIATENAETIDPDDRRVPFVAKSLIAVAGYLRTGLAQIGLERDVVRAAQYLRYAATSFGDEDAQFELAKLYLKGEGVEDLPFARHYLSVLAQKGHPGAQAVLAEQYWKGGSVVARDQKRALALITVAVDNAPHQDRLWIADIYHNIFCGSSQGVRSNADGLVAYWRKQYQPLRSLDIQQRSSLGAGGLEADAARRCSDGEPVRPGTRAAPVAPPASTAGTEKTDPVFLQGSALGIADTTTVPRR